MCAGPVSASLNIQGRRRFLFGVSCRWDPSGPLGSHRQLREHTPAALCCLALPLLGFPLLHHQIHNCSQAHAFRLLLLACLCGCSYVSNMLEYGFSFCNLLHFIRAVPAGIYANVQYGTSLSNVDWMHGSAESLLTLTNLFLVLGLRDALRKLKAEKENPEKATSEIKEETQTSVCD